MENYSKLVKVLKEGLSFGESALIVDHEELTRGIQNDLKNKVYYNDPTYSRVLAFQEELGLTDLEVYKLMTILLYENKDALGNELLKIRLQEIEENDRKKAK